MLKDLLIKKNSNNDNLITENKKDKSQKQYKSDGKSKNKNNKDTNYHENDNNKKKKRIFNNTNNIYHSDFTKHISNKHNKSIIAYNFCYDEDNLLTRFIFKNKIKNFEFYYCFKSAKECPSKSKLDIKLKEFIEYIRCNKNINHEKNTYENFEMIIINDKIGNIGLNLKSNQRYYIRYLFKNRFSYR